MRLFLCQIRIQHHELRKKEPFIFETMEKLHSVVQCNSCAKTMAKIGDIAAGTLHSLCTRAASFQSATLYGTLPRNCLIFTRPLPAVWFARIINWTSARCTEIIMPGWPYRIFPRMGDVVFMQHALHWILYESIEADAFGILAT